MRTKPNGFSMIELMMAIAIAAVMATLASYMVVSVVRQSALNGNTRHLASMLQDARVRAITQGRPCGVYIGSLGDSAYPGQGILFSKINPADTSRQYLPDAGTDISVSSASLAYSSSRGTLGFGTGVPDAGNTVVMFQSDGTPIVTTTNPTGGTSAQYDFSAGQYQISFVRTDSASTNTRSIALRSDGTVRIQ